MPLKPYTPMQPPEDPDAPSALRRLLGLGVRLGSGALAAPGGWWGAGVGGGGEALAEAIEGSDLSAPRIGVEAGIGAIPFGATFKQGKALVSALRGGLYNAVGETGRELAMEGTVDPKNVLIAGGLGAGISGGLAKFLGGGAKVDPEKFIVESSGGRPIREIPGQPPPPPPPSAPRFRTRDEYEVWKAGQGGVTPPVPSSGGYRTPIVGEPAPAQVGDEVKFADTLRTTLGKTIDDLPGMERAVRGADAGIAARAQEAAQIRAGHLKDEASQIRLEDRADLDWLTRQQKAAQEYEAQRAIEEAKAQGLEPQTPTVTQTHTASIPGGKARAVTKFALPKAEDEAQSGVEELSRVLSPEKGVAPAIDAASPAQTVGIAGKLRDLIDSHDQGLIDDDQFEALSTYWWRQAEQGGVAGQVERLGEGLPTVIARGPGHPAAHPASAPVEVPAVEGVGAPESPLARFFKSRVDALGRENPFGYYATQEAARRGEAPKEAARIMGQGLRREAKEAGLPTGSAATAAAPPPEPPTPDWVKDQLGLIDRIKGPLTGGESGAVSPALLAHLGLGAAGAAVGAATDPLDNPALSALAGGTVGASLPLVVRALSGLKVPPETLQSVDTSTPEGIKESARRIYESLPQVQRFNYLMSVHGVAANGIVGPYGSILTGALEAGLSGDPRGWKLLSSLSPGQFMKQYLAHGSRQEAQSLIQHGEIGREANVVLDEGASPVQKLLGAPGVMLTTGDVVARRLAQAAGFSEAEARAMTLTNEPEFGLSRQLANIGRGNTLGQIVFPFRRTPVNLIEQGALRTPGLGAIVQSFRETPDPIKTQIVQQGLGAGIGGLNFLLGSSLDPESGRTMQRYTSNLAGRYGLPATMGFAAGQAYAGGKPVARTAVGAGLNRIPLPATDQLVEWNNYLLGEGPLPRGAMPEDLQTFLNPPAVQLRNLPPLRRR